MRFVDALNEVRRKIGVINLNDKSDVEWMCRKIINDNREVFDALAD
jgi:hypothetical protein